MNRRRNCEICCSEYRFGFTSVAVSLLMKLFGLSYLWGMVMVVVMEQFNHWNIGKMFLLEEIELLMSYVKCL